MTASCGFLKNELSQFIKEGVTLADSVETLGVDLRTRVKRLGAKEKARRKKCKVRFSIIKKNKSFPEEQHEGGRQEVAACGHDASKNVEGAFSGDGSTERFKLRRQMAAASGKKSTTSLSSFMETFGLEVEEELSSLATQTWAEGVWTGK